jgi:hypothetical protein
MLATLVSLAGAHVHDFERKAELASTIAGCAARE